MWTGGQKLEETASSDKSEVTQLPKFIFLVYREVEKCTSNDMKKEKPCLLLLLLFKQTLRQKCRNNNNHITECLICARHYNKHIDMNYFMYYS